MQNHTNASPTIYNQVRNVLLLGIVITLLLSLVASFLLNLMSENRSRDQTLESSAQVAANMPLLTEDLYAPETTEYIRRTVQNVPSIDVFAVYDREGTPIAFYDLATGQDDATALASLSQDIVDWFLAGNATLIYNPRRGRPLRLRRHLRRRRHPHRLRHDGDLHPFHPGHHGADGPLPPAGRGGRLGGGELSQPPPVPKDQGQPAGVRA